MKKTNVQRNHNGKVVETSTETVSMNGENKVESIEVISEN